MRFKKIYVEITNSCNFNCSFCFPSVRKKQRVSLEFFSTILFRIKPFINYIYLHVLGEPFLHPLLPQFIKLAHQQGFYVNLTTNGSLLRNFLEVPEMNLVRQFNISLHDAQENVSADSLDSYLNSVINFAHTFPSSYIAFRLWNKGAEAIDSFNNRCLSSLNTAYKTSFSLEDLSLHNLTLAPHVFLNNGARFLWPGFASARPEEHDCYALRDHIAILSDGSVVPCCLDADAHLLLGNILDSPLEDILNSPKATAIFNGFRQRKAVMPFCQRCGFILDK